MFNELMKSKLICSCRTYVVCINCLYSIVLWPIKFTFGLYFSKALFEGLIFGGAYIRRGLSTEGNLRFKIDWASLIVGSKFTVFALFYFVFEGNFPSTSPRGAYIWRGDLTEGFLRYRVWGAYIWRGLYMEGLIFGI